MYATMMNSETGCRQLSLNAFDSLKKEEVWCKKKKNMKVSIHIFPTHEAMWEKGRSCSVQKFDDLRGKQ